MDANLSRFRSAHALSFNPRARDGREAPDWAKCAAVDVSIHAPVMDANSSTDKRYISDRFNPRARDGREA